MKMSEWQSGAGARWYAACVDDLGNSSGAWWYPARILNIPLEEYVRILISNGAKIKFNRDNKNLFYYWDKKDYSLMHKFVLMMNKKLRGL